MERLDPQLRRIIDEGMRQAQPDLRTEARMLAGLVARLPPAPGGGDAPPGATPSAATPNALGSLATLKLVVGGAIGSAVVAAAIAIASREPTTPSDRTVAAAPQPQAAAPRDSATPEPPAASLPIVGPSSAPIENAPDVAPPRRAPSPSGASRRPISVAADPHDDSIAAELALLDAAEAALDAGDDRGALALTATHGQRHPDGQLALERDAIAAAAACGLGLPDAPRRAAAFLAAHPRAAAAAKVRARCETATIVDPK
jgi:hypothetical protein